VEPKIEELKSENTKFLSRTDESKVRQQIHEFDSQDSLSCKIRNILDNIICFIFIEHVFAHKEGIYKQIILFEVC
jgi:hypothetical protein